MIGLLRAYQSFRAQHHERVQLVIIGQKGWKSEHFFQGLGLHPFHQDITLTGFVPLELRGQAYTYTLALVYPRFHEGFGFPIVEALACGANVICPNNSSLPEVGGQSAYYYPVEREDHLLTVARRGPDVVTRAKQGHGWAINFSWQKYAKTFDGLFDQPALQP